MLNTQVKDWITGFENQFFTHTEGFHRLPYLANTPNDLLEVLKQIPYTKFDEGEKVIHAKNQYTDGAIYYRELEEGFWIILAEMEFKKNVATKAHYSSDSCDYYFLSHFLFVNDLKSNKPVVCWSLNKPGTDIKGYFNTGDKGIYINFAFNKAWFSRNIATDNFAGENNIDEYLSPNVDHMIWKNIVPHSDAQVKRILEMLKPENKMRFNTLGLKMLCLNFILKFFITISDIYAISRQGDFHDADKKIVRDAEKILMENLTNTFPGIVELAKMLNTSPTKLKSSFKAIYHTSIYQYYQRKQMELALELLKTKRTSLKDMALTFGYTNPSKFSSAFKKHHDFLPSEI